MNKRQQQVQDGAYDGRYRVKIVQDKKKQARRKWARKKQKNNPSE